MDKEKLMIQYDNGMWVPKDMCTIDQFGGADDCASCKEVCKDLDGDCEECPVQGVFNQLAAYDGSREESCVSDEILYRAVNTQVEFLRRYRERYDDEPEFDIVILKIMLELKERRAAEGKNGHNETD